MSLDLNMNISSSKPVIREAQSMQNDGGGGNLGYMAQGENEEKKQQYADVSIFNKAETDSFSFEKDFKVPEKEEEISIIKMIKDFIKKIIKVFVK
jgi:hypothetical protein